MPQPDITLGFLAAGRFEARRLIPYVACQSVGAGLASVTLWTMFPSHPTLGATLPTGAAAQSFVLEALLTLILMAVVLSVSTGSKEKGLLTGVAVGAVIALSRG